MNHFLSLNKLRWFWRLPIKLALFGFTVAAVCFPSVGRLRQHLIHWSNPNLLIQPDNPSLQPLVEEVRSTLPPDQSPLQILKGVEKYVYKRIPYEWDWNNWGNADYLPTVDEVLAKGKEDCDGRAVIAASILASLGFQAQLVTDFSHVWVKTEHGEAMGPGKRKAVIATDKGLALQSGAWEELPKALAYGISPFPLQRELIMLVVAWWLLLKSQGTIGGNLLALGLLLDGLLFLRVGGQDYLRPIVWMQLVGAANLLTAWICLSFGVRRDVRLVTGVIS